MSKRTIGDMIGKPVKKKTPSKSQARRLAAQRPAGTRPVPERFSGVSRSAKVSKATPKAKTRSRSVPNKRATAVASKPKSSAFINGLLRRNVTLLGVSGRKYHIQKNRNGQSFCGRVHAQGTAVRSVQSEQRGAQTICKDCLRELLRTHGGSVKALRFRLTGRPVEIRLTRNTLAMYSESREYLRRL